MCTRGFFASLLLPLSYWYPDLSEGLNSVSGQRRVDKESNHFWQGLEKGAGKRGVDWESGELDSGRLGVRKRP